MEEIKYGSDIFEIPSGLSEDFSYLLDIISPDTWNNILTDEHREMLMKFLPDFPEDDLNEKTHTLEMFFMNENFYFGCPLQQFYINLKQGFYNPEISKFRKIQRKILHKSYKYRQKKYFHNLLEEILVKRRDLLEGNHYKSFIEEKLPLHNANVATVPTKGEICMQRVRKRYFKELKSVKSEANCDSDLSDDENYPEGPGLSLNKKQRRQLFLLESSFPPMLCPVRSTHTKGSLALDLEAYLTSARNPFDSSEEQFRNLMSVHLMNQKKKSSPSLDTRGITLKSVLERTETLSRKPLQRPQQPATPPISFGVNRTTSNIGIYKKAPPRKKAKISSTNSSFPSALPLLPPEEIKRELSSDSSSEDELTDMDSTKDTFRLSPVHSSMEDIKPSLTAELTQETHLSFFCLLRDIICSTSNQRMSRHQLLSSISTWQHSTISPLNEWFCLSDSWVHVLPSAVNFLCGNLTSDYLPSDFVPFIEYKSTLKLFQWIGAGRDSDANLEPLCQYWLSNRDNISCEWPKDTITSSDTEDTKAPLQIKSSKTGAVVASEEESTEITEYHEQEKSRYEQPHKAFRYKMNGYESVIGPVKGVYSQQVGNTTKARGHMLLVPDRPPYVTILSLVWDAVARLPNSEGTKMDICELLKESQFLVPINTPSLENTLNSVVSGALDRLQNEKDPCVKFDTSRKLWGYLHKSRSEKELEMMHQLKFRNGGGKTKSQTSIRKAVKKKEDASLKQGPPNVVMEQFTPSIKQMDGSEVRIKDEDILKNWVKMSNAKKKKEKSAKVAPHQQKQDFTKLKKLGLGSLDATTLPCGSQSLPVLSPQTLLQKSSTPEDTKVIMSGEVTPQKLCSPIQFSKGGSSLLTASSPLNSLSPSGSVKSPLQAQTSRKYHSSSEKKKLMKSAEGTSFPTNKSSALTTATKLIHTQPTISTTASGATQKGIKLLQYSNPNIQAKGVVGNTSLVVDTSTAVPALVGQKLVVAGNRVLVQGGKVLHNVSPGSVSGRGKQVLAGMLPAQHIMAVNNLKKHGSEQQTIEGGRFIQIATLDAQSGFQKQGGYQKLTLVPQFNPTTVSSTAQKVEATPAVGSVAKSAITSGEVKLKLGSTAFATASGNIISLGGKQILLTTKGGPANRAAQIHQVVVGDSRGRIDVSGADSLRSVTPTQQIVVPSNAGGQQQATVVSASTTQQTIAATTSGNLGQQQRLGIGGQQIVFPASALTGSPINLKRLQAFPSFKVVTASQLSQQQQQQRGKPVVAHILAPSSTTSAGATISTAKLALQIAAPTDTSQDKKQ